MYKFILTNEYHSFICFLFAYNSETNVLIFKKIFVMLKLSDGINQLKIFISIVMTVIDFYSE